MNEPPPPDFFPPIVPPACEQFRDEETALIYEVAEIERFGMDYQPMPKVPPVPEEGEAD